MPIGYFHRMYGYDSGAKCEFTKPVFEEKKRSNNNNNNLKNIKQIKW